MSCTREIPEFRTRKQQNYCQWKMYEVKGSKLESVWGVCGGHLPEMTQENRRKNSVSPME